MKRLIFILLAFCGAVFPQQNALLMPWTPQQFTNTNGTVLANGKVCVYLAGTSTGVASYTDATAAVANNIPPNAILLDSTGRPTSGGIWLKPTQAYKIVVLTAGSDSTCNTGVTIKSQDNVGISASVSANNTFTGTNIFTGATTLGNGNLFTPVTFSNHNAIYWAGPGASPTIDQAVTACGVNPCFVVISPLYSGPESTNLVTTSTGYLVYSGANNVTIEDYRANAATPGNPTGAPLYPIGYGGRWDGELSRIFMNDWCASPADSCVGSASAGWLSGTWPTNSGSQYGSSSVEIVHGTNTVSNSGSVVGGNDAEVWLDPTTIDRPILDARAHTGQILINRANAVGTAIKTAVYHATNCLNQSTSGAILQTCYGFDADPFSGGANRNYSYHSGGNMLFENNAAIDVVDSGFTISTATESANIVTITTSATCNYTTGTVVHVAGVGVATYNGDWVVLAPGCNGGSTFTYTNPTSGLTSSSGGTTGTNRRIILFRSDNGIDFLPLANLACCGTASYNFKNQGGTPLFSIYSNRLQSTVTHEFFGALQLDGATSGTITVNVPAVAGANTITVPAASGTLSTVSCNTSQRTETAADANLLTCAIPTQAGSYRVRFVMSISAANAANLGWTATWTDSNGNAAAPTNLAVFAAGSATPVLTFSTSSAGQIYGYLDVDVNNAGTSIVVKTTFSGTSFTAKASATVERII